MTSPEETWDDGEIFSFDEISPKMKELGDRAAELFDWLHSGGSWSDPPRFYVCF